MTDETTGANVVELAARETVGTVDAAAIVGLSPATLESMRSRGGGPPFRKVRRRVVYVVAELRAWRDARGPVECTSEY